VQQVKRLLAKARTAFANFSSPDEPGGEGVRIAEAKTESVVPVFSPLDPAFVDDPHSVYAALRERDPVHRSPSGAWVLTRHEDIAAALADPRFGNAPSPYAVVHERNRHRYVCADVANNIIPFMDAPHHAPARKIIGRSFNGTMRRRAPDMEGIARKILADVRERAARGEAGEFDVLHDFGTPYSVAVLCQLLGLPEADGGRLKEWSEWFFYLFSIIPSEEVRSQLDKALVQFRSYFAGIIDERRANFDANFDTNRDDNLDDSPGDDLISAMLGAEFNGARLSDAQLIDTCMLLFADGVENVDRCIATATSLLLAHPDQLQLLRRQPELMPRAVEEILRFESPAQFVGRVALEDLSIRGVTVRKNSAVLLVLGSANRDSDRFEEADRFDITRAPQPNLAFGRGQHACIGGPLVRIEVEVALRELLQSLPRLAAKGDLQRWTPRLGHRWLAEFPATY
jgi:pimeloyl-[acyl-carrier protein] synthase